MKLGLGSAQFGLDYGVSNESGRTPVNEVARILELAAASGVCIVDTAPAYGDAEEVLGSCGVEGFDVVTKVTRGILPDAIRTSAETSLRRLRIGRLHGLIAHDVADVLRDDEGEARATALLGLRDEGLAHRVGVSVYDPADAVLAVERYGFDIVQLPLNVLDQRALQSGALERLAASGAEVHTRSVFLQGLLLMPVADVPEYFHRWAETLQMFEARSAAAGVSRVSAALGFVTSLPSVASVVVGVNDAEQLADLIKAYDEGGLSDYGPFAQSDVDLLDPSRWEV